MNTKLPKFYVYTHWILIIYHWSYGIHEDGRPTQFVPHAVEEIWNERSENIPDPLLYTVEIFDGLTVNRLLVTLN